MENGKEIKYMNFKLLARKNQNYLVFGRSKYGKTNMTNILINSLESYLIGAFCTYKDKKRYQYCYEVTDSTKFQLYKELFKLHQLGKNNQSRSFIILDDCISSYNMKPKDLSKFLSSNRTSRISYIMTFSKLINLAPSIQCNCDWIIILGGLSREEYKKIYLDYGKCFTCFSEFYGLMYQLETKEKGTGAIFFKNIYDSNGTDPGPYYLAIQNNYNNQKEEDYIRYPIFESTNSNNIPSAPPLPSINNQKNNEDECAICLDNIILNDIDDPIIELNCKHIFHEKCLNEWMEQTQGNNCPLCRGNIN